MPKKGFKSISIKGKDYAKLHGFYKNLLENDRLPDGVHSFAGFVDYSLSNYISNREKLRKFATKIDKVPEKFLEYRIKRSIK